MSSLLIQCPKCRSSLMGWAFNQPKPAPCPSCSVPLQVELFPAFFRRAAAARDGEAVMVEGEASCFYHPEKKAVLPCDACGRFVCALCDCELKGRHLCPACLQSGQKKQSIQGLEDVRTLYAQQAFVLSLLPFFITGAAAVFIVLRYRKTPGSIVRPMRWAMPVALIFGSLQTVLFLFLIVRSLLP